MKHALLAFACLTLAATPSTQAQSPACIPSNGLNFICGLQKPEDLVLIPGTRWLIASGMDPGAGLHLIDTRAKRAQPLYASDTPARPDRNRFASCPGPLDPHQAVLHGLSLRPAQAGRYTLYATNQRRASRGLAKATAPSGATKAQAATTLEGMKPPRTTISANGSTSIRPSCVKRKTS